MTQARDSSKRRAPRLATHLDGSLLGRSARPVRVVDLSLTGCLVQCPARLDHGAILDLEIRLPDPVAAKVRVASASLDGAVAPEEAPRFLAGLEFLGLAAQAQASLRRFLDAERKRRRDADAAAQ
jgi:PilZ domain